MELVTTMNRAERTLSSSSAMSRNSDSFDMELDEEEALRKAARAGIQLLETNRELQEELAALREQVGVLESERPSMRAALAARDEELVDLREDRKKCIVENNTLRHELKAKSTLVTDLLEREDRLKTAANEAEAAKQVAEFQLDTVRAELEALQRQDAAKSEAADKQRFTVANPAATYDSNQASVFTVADYEELQQRLQAVSEENEAKSLELRSVRKDADTLRRKTVKLAECVAHMERLERRNEKLQSANDALREEQMEERAVLDSLRSMNLMYKQLAESRADCTCAEHPENTDPKALGTTVRDVLIEANMKLETELRELRAAMHLPQPSEGTDALAQALKRTESSGNVSEDSDATCCDTNSYNGETAVDAGQDRLVKKVQDLTEKLNLSRDMLRHTKVQWSAAVASQKALEECNKASQEEVKRLSQQLEFQAAGSDREDTESLERKKSGLLDEDKDGRWTEETAPYPAPPGDLNSPLIKCLLEHWTTDKSKVMALTDWLHNAVRGTGRSTPLRLLNLTSEVTAGFVQLLVPIMRERHGVSVSIYRRDSVHILSDLVLQTNHPSVTVQSFATEPTSDAKGDEVLTRLRDPEHTAEPQFDGAEQSSTGSHFLKGEAEFLYG